MGYVLKARLASFFGGAAVASAVGLYALDHDYRAAHHSLSQQVKDVYKSLDERVSTLEKRKEVEASNPVVETTD